MHFCKAFHLRYLQGRGYTFVNSIFTFVNFIYKEKSGSSKIRRNTEYLTSMIDESFIFELSILVLALYSYFEDKKKTWTSFKSLVSKSARTWQLKRPGGIDRLLLKTMSSSFHMEWKHLSKLVVTMTNTIEKIFYAVATFEGLWVASLQAE